MNFDSILRSNHELKKNGYQIIRKLHKMECRDGASRAYEAQFNDTYYFVLGCKALVEIIKAEYPDAAAFGKRCDAFLSYLNSAAQSKSRLNKSLIGGFLHAYTIFFNIMIAKKKPFFFNERIIYLWNVECLMAYGATWGSNK